MPMRPTSLGPRTRLKATARLARLALIVVLVVIAVFLTFLDFGLNYTPDCHGRAKCDSSEDFGVRALGYGALLALLAALLLGLQSAARAVRKRPDR